MLRPGRSLVLLGTGFVLLLAALALKWAGAQRDPNSSLRGRGTPSLDAHWIKTKFGDFKEAVVERLPGSATAIRVRADTRDTRDDTVKFLGARSVHPYAVWPKSRLLVDIDWNNQPNGSYLSAGLVLSPEATTENPLTGADWLKVEYVGVPPGKNARMVIASKARGREKFLHTEGWPDKNKVGRPIGVQRVEVVIEGGKVQIQENGQTVWDSSEKLLSFEKGYLYLQMSSHSNYPAREVFFKNVTISD